MKGKEPNRQDNVGKDLADDPQRQWNLREEKILTPPGGSSESMISTRRGGSRDREARV